MTTYDSRVDTLTHSVRVGELLVQMLQELLPRMVSHDRSKLEEPERPVKVNLVAMGPALDHHYRSNRHHPEHFSWRVDGMTLLDLLEMLADWKAATGRHDSGSLKRSLVINRDRVKLSPQMFDVLWNTAGYLDWLPPIEQSECGVLGRAPNGEKLVCNLRCAKHEIHCDGMKDSLCWRAGELGGA